MSEKRVEEAGEQPADEATFPALVLDKTAFSVATLFDESETRAYWHARTPHERLRHVEILRRMNYGNRATARLQRVFAVAQSSWC
jgi:hypothetical protein